MIRSLARDVAAICAAVAIVGLAFGALATAAGISLGMTVALSLLVLAGGAQLMVVATIAAGASPWMAVLGGLLINARHIPFGLAMSGLVADRWRGKLLAAHLLVDEVVAFSRAQDEPRRVRVAYWFCGLALLVTWNVSTLVGAWLGDAVPDPERFGIDAAFPAALFALLLPALRGRSSLQVMTRRSSLTGAVLAVLSSLFLPVGVPVLTSLLGLFAARRATTEAETP